jgi:putative IMPACT (imprinted ancient) family translation regulator
MDTRYPTLFITLQIPTYHWKISVHIIDDVRQPLYQNYFKVSCYAYYRPDMKLSVRMNNIFLRELFRLWLALTLGEMELLTMLIII